MDHGQAGLKRPAPAAAGSEGVGSGVQNMRSYRMAPSVMEPCCAWLHDSFPSMNESLLTVGVVEDADPY